MSILSVEKVSFDTVLDVFFSNCKQLVDAKESKTKMREREITRLLQILGADTIISFLFLLSLVLPKRCTSILLCIFPLCLLYRLSKAKSYEVN